MEAVLDRFGRIVIPKEARDELDIGPGSRLEVVVTADAIVLRCVSESQPLHVRDGVLVYGGQVIGDLSSVVSVDRAARTARLARGTRRRSK